MIDNDIYIDYKLIIIVSISSYLRRKSYCIIPSVSVCIGVGVSVGSGIGINNVLSTIVISTSVISNNPLSLRENLVLVLTQKSKLR